MSSMDTLTTHLTAIDFNWIKKKYDQITNHPAWAGGISESEANQLLEGKSAFTYVLRSAGKEHAYFISFVKQDQVIKHQYFTLELDLKGWHYKNAVVAPPTDNIDHLIPQMMHCDPAECKILKYPHT